MGKDFKELFHCSNQQKTKYHNGRWDKCEHERFLRACYEYKEDWEKIEAFIRTRSIPQIRSHAQKYIIKLSKKYRVKLSQKKFLKVTAKHLNYVCSESSDINHASKMNKYDQNIFKMFKYYKREILPETNDLSIKTQESSLKEPVTDEQSLIIDEIENPSKIDNQSIIKDDDDCFEHNVNDYFANSLSKKMQFLWYIHHKNSQTLKFLNCKYGN